ncbi:LysR family transcriptional regulator [Ramlibacter albus]|uniref:LysR family transcriptional regulator n=1 Tax=Ramlibacter albus TaxID=2079448 RepID=A0A923MD43_9BURK|nr:LysR family transcriptional regulator [Ramlibacter albus]MBC5767321.1 LysR family transcriptional regulator [Ramlibacter albus]
MELQQIRYFLAVHRHGSFSRACDECEVSQPALTAAVKKLEGEVGGELFHREGKKLVLTPLGRLIYPALEQAVAGAQSARSLAENFKLLRQAPLKLGLQTTIGPTRIASFLSAFHRRQPGVELTVEDGSFSQLLDRLETGDIDLAVVSSAPQLPDAFRSEKLYSEPYVVVIPAGHPLGRLQQVRLADVNGEAYVDRLACEMREAVMAVSQQAGVSLYATFRSEREDWIEAMVQAGLGFAFMPKYSIRSAALHQRPLVDPPVARDVLAVDVRGRARSPAAKLFVEEIKGHTWAA